MEKYKQSQFADAIVDWESIYRDLGPKRGYRLAFNLARAYDAYGDSTRAAERYETYLAEVDVRRTLGEELEAIVQKQEADARARLDDLARSHARLRVVVGARPVPVQIDAGEPRVSGFVAYVRPGEHVVVFEPGTPRARTERHSVKEGVEIRIEPPPPEEAPRPVAYTTVTERPYPLWVVYVSGGLAAASTIVPILTYDRALGIRAEHDALASADLQRTRGAALENEYTGARATAYATLAVPLTLSLVTGSLAAFYYLGTRQTQVPLAAGPGALRVSF